MSGHRACPSPHARQLGLNQTQIREVISTLVTGPSNMTEPSHPRGTPVQELRTRKTVLRGIDLTIEPGTVLGLLGANGSGRTTTHQQCHGSACCGRRRGACHASSAKTPGTFPAGAQGPPRLCATGGDDLSVDARAASDRLHGRVLSAVGITPFVDKLCRPVGTCLWRVASERLSTGQLQTVGIVLAARASNLSCWSSMNRSQVSTRRPATSSSERSSICSKDHQQTILFSTHITSDLERIAQRVAIMGDGKIRFYGELDDLKDRVKRLRITARHDLPAEHRRPGSLRCEVAGQTPRRERREISDERPRQPTCAQDLGRRRFGQRPQSRRNLCGRCTMESQPESTAFSDWARSVEPWVWPAIAAVVVSGTLLLCAIVGLCWLAARPARQPIVIWMPSAVERPVNREQSTVTHATVALEDRPDARAN